MGLITISNIEDNTSASANTLNQRFGIIAKEVNGNLDSSNYKNKSVTVEKLADGILSVAYPLGSIYMNANSAINPATLLGFGTWISFGEGRVLVGKAATGTFATVGGTMGAETHSLTAAENGAHNHALSDPGHAHNVSLTGSNTETVTNSRSIEWTNPVDTINVTTSTSGSNVSIAASGSGTPHNNIQPSLVVYMWMRTV
jgi:hypothetical protein